MTRPSNYGKLQRAQNPEAYKIWLSRFDEPDLCEPMSALLWQPPEAADPMLFRRLMEVLKEIRPRYVSVLMRRHFYGQTLDEVGAMEGLTRERIRQMEMTAIRLVRNRMVDELADWRRP